VFDVLMPQLGEAVAEGTISRWLKSPGDSVRVGEPLFEVSTDKVDSDVPADVDGWLSEVIVGEGETVAVGEVLARITTTAGDAAIGTEPSVEALSPPVDETDPAIEAALSASALPAPSTEPVPAAPTHGNGAGATQLVSPRVRQLLEAHELDASSISGTGGRGRLTVDDVMRFTGVDSTSQVSPPLDPRASTTWSVSADPGVDPAADRLDATMPPTQIRLGSGERLVRSSAAASRGWISVDVDYSNVERARLPATEAFREREGLALTMLPFVARASIDALGRLPLVSANVGNDDAVAHPTTNLGIVVDLDLQEPVVVVIHGAETKRLRTLAREVGLLDADARARQTTPDRFVESTFTIADVGSHGIDIAAPIVGEPEIATLAMGVVRRQPAVVVSDDGTEGVAILPIGALSLSWGKRDVSGAYAAAFLHATRQILETRNWHEELV